jgi:hemerythrin-like domain-containing protein
MQPLREEHRILVPHIDALRTTGDAVGSVPIEALCRLVAESFAFLTDHLIPHAVVEDRAFYPVVQRVMRSGDATRTMSREHVEVARLARELGDLGSRLAEADELQDDLARDLRRVLYGLYALVRLHFVKEEEVYLPLVEASLTPAEVAALFQSMHAAAAAARTGAR